MWLYHSEDMKVLTCIFNNNKNDDEKVDRPKMY